MKRLIGHYLCVAVASSSRWSHRDGSCIEGPPLRSLYGPTVPAPVNVYPVVVHHGFIQAKRASAFAEQKEENEPECMSEHGGLLLAARPFKYAYTA